MRKLLDLHFVGMPVDWIEKSQFMLVQVVAGDGDDGTATRSLYRWLTRDPDARRFVRVALGAGSSEGYMGALEVISAVLSQATAIGTLAVAVVSWRDSRAEPSSVKITVGERSVVIEGETADLAEVMIRSLVASSGPENAGGQLSVGEPVGNDSPGGGQANASA